MHENERSKNQKRNETKMFSKIRLQSTKTTSFAKTQMTFIHFFCNPPTKLSISHPNKMPALDDTFSSQNEQISIKNMCFCSI